MNNFLNYKEKTTKIFFTEHALEETKMKCFYCGGRMEKSKVGYSINRKDYHLYLEEVPTYVCATCKEKLFDEGEVKAIQKLIKHIEADVRQLQTA